MARKVIFSFNYDEDGWRAATVRNIGKINADNPLSDNDWETIKKGGDAAIQRWIDQQIKGTSCCVVLVGAHTAGRRWVKHEIEESWKAGKGVLGIRIHKLKDADGNTSVAGSTPFSLTVSGQYLGSLIRLYDPVGIDSKAVYATIAAGVEDWVEEAIRIRAANTGR
jgi:hypothetical protein